MIGLLSIRAGAVLARLALQTGSMKAGNYYVAMEVGDWEISTMSYFLEIKA